MLEQQSIAQLHDGHTYWLGSPPRTNLGSIFVHLVMPPYHHITCGSQEKAEGGTPAVQRFIMEETEVMYAHILWARTSHVVSFNC